VAVDLSQFKKMFPEFADIPNPRLTLFSEFAAENINRSVFAERADRAESLLMAHFLTLANRDGAGGPVTQERVGDLSTSYGQMGDKNQLLSTTSYGQMFLTIMKSLSITPRVANEC